LIESAAQAVINRLLRNETWARERLLPFAGRVVSVECFPFLVRLTVTDTGEVGPAPADAAADTRITLTPGILMRLAARDEVAWTQAQVEGDTTFAAAVQYLARNLRWDFEEDLARLFGDVAGVRMASSIRSAAAWHAEAAGNLAHAFAEYWTEERPGIARRADIEAYCGDVDTVRDDVDRLGKRIERLERLRT
jgi:ubiquinone biosynthesis protein UbiJ